MVVQVQTAGTLRRQQLLEQTATDLPSAPRAAYRLSTRVALMLTAIAVGRPFPVFRDFITYAASAHNIGRWGFKLGWW